MGQDEDVTHFDETLYIERDHTRNKRSFLLMLGIR